MTRLANRLLVAASTVWAATASAELVDRVAVVVNNNIIALTEIEARAAPELQRASTEQNPAKRAELRKEALKRAMDALIGEMLMETQLKELNIDVSDAEVDLAVDDVMKQNNKDKAEFEQLLLQEGYSLTSYRSFMKKHLARMKLVNLKVRSKVRVTEEDLRAEYGRTTKSDSEEEVRARHLLVVVAPNATTEKVESARKKAAALADEARKPGVDFVKLVKEKSEGSSKDDGGDLGFFRRGVMVPAFEQAVFPVPVGGISNPVRTSQGWHVVKVEERRTPEPRPYEELKDQLREKLLRTQLERYTEQYIQDLRAAAVVEVKI